VDRYGQTVPLVKAIRYFSPDSAVDGVVLDVLLNKAREIHRTLGTHVPVPEESESVTEAVLNALFLRGRKTGANQLQLDLGFEAPQVASLHARWERDAERERINRTRFAQRALKPDEVRKELEAADAVLGDPDAVREFVLNAAQRLGLAITRDRCPDVYRVAVGPEATVTLPTTITYTLPTVEGRWWRISFTSPTPEGAEYLGRNHRFVAALARFLVEEALTKHGQAIASRCGAIRTRTVSRLTTVALLRVPYLLHQPERAPRPSAWHRRDAGHPTGRGLEQRCPHASRGPRRAADHCPAGLRGDRRVDPRPWDASRTREAHGFLTVPAHGDGMVLVAKVAGCLSAGADPPQSDVR